MGLKMSEILLIGAVLGCPLVTLGGIVSIVLGVVWWKRRAAVAPPKP
jgi:uncharacterized iron-regulated membrane protein